MALVPVGLFAITMMTSANGYVQTTTDPVMRGRVMALYMAIFMGGIPIGAPLVGGVANVAGPRWSTRTAPPGQQNRTTPSNAEALSWNAEALS